MAHVTPCAHVPQGYPPCQVCAALNNAANSSSQTPHSEPHVCQFLDMLEQSFANENQQTGARPAGRELYITPSQMNLGVGSSPSNYPLFAGSRAQQPSQTTQPAPTPGPPIGTNSQGRSGQR